MPNRPDHIQSVLVDITAGHLLDVSKSNATSDALTDFAAISPELFSSESVPWNSLFAAFDGPADDRAFQDLVLVGEEVILIAMRMPSQPGLATLCVAPASKGVGLALSEAREHARAFAEE